MSAEDIVVPVGTFAHDDLGSSDFEEVLETLVMIAQNQGRTFLAYLLIMALMHAREEGQGRIEMPH